MNILRQSVLPALVLTATVFVFIACQFTTANIDRAVMARSVNEDNSPNGETSVYNMHESLLHCCVSMANTPEGTKVKSIWRFDEGETERSVIDSTEIDVATSGWVDFTLALTEMGLPYSRYSVDLYINGKYARSVGFSVEPMFNESVVKEAVLATAVNENSFPAEVVTAFQAGIKKIFAPIYVQGQPAGSVFSSAWYQHDAAGARALITDADIAFEESGWIGFSLTLDAGLPAGKYSVDILHNGAVEQTLEFSAQ